MEIFMYTIIFIIGTFCGSFLTLAVYRVPLHQDILYKHSYCPKCNHRLELIDLIPVLSYILLGGKCRYCKNKIRIRYLIYEVITGALFVLFAISIRFNVLTINIGQLVYVSFSIMYLIGILLILGIDKERKEISMPVVLYEIIISTIYIIYVYITQEINIYTYIIYLFVILMLSLYNIKFLKKTNQNNYIIQIAILCMVMAIATFELRAILTVLITIIQIIVFGLYKKQKKDKNKIPVGFILCYSNIICMIAINIIENYVH